MARPTQYQKLSLQLDADNKKLKEKLSKTKAQMAQIKGQSTQMRKGFGSSIDAMGGKAGALKASIGGLLNSVTSMNPAILGLAAVGGALGLAFQDLTAYTDTWEGSLTDAGRTLKAVQVGFKTFIKSTAEARGKALAENGIMGWISETASQIQGLTTGATQAMAAVQVGVASIVNDAMLSWQKGLLDTTVKTRELRAETQILYNQFRDRALIPEERLQAIDEYKEKALNLYKLQKANAERELKFLEQESKLTGNSFEDNMKIETVKGNIADLEREYHKLLGRTVEFETSITAEIEKQRVARLPNPAEKKKLSSAIKDPELPAQLEKIRLMTEQQSLEKSHAEWQAELHEETKMRQEEVIGGYGEMARVIGFMANGIANAKDNWAAMGASVAAGIAQMIPAIKGVIVATKALFVAKQAEAVAGAAASSQSMPFPGNLVAMATSIGAVLASVAPFVGSFARGTNFVPNTGMAMVHKGEKILRKDDAGGNINLVGNWTLDGRVLRFMLDEDDRVTGNSF